MYGKLLWKQNTSYRMVNIFIKNYASIINRQNKSKGLGSFILHYLYLDFFIFLRKMLYFC